MAVYSASQIKGKSLIAQKDVKITRYASDSAPSVYTVKKGATIGVVYSFLLPNVSRSSVWWMFEDAYKNPFYCEHVEGNFSIKGLVQQGVLSVKEQIEIDKKKAENAQKDGFDKTKEIATIGLIAVIAIVVAQLAKTFKSN